MYILFLHIPTFHHDDILTDQHEFFLPLKSEWKEVENQRKKRVLTP